MMQLTENIADTRRIIGLSNEGNTCYINSALQCLLAIREFAEHIILVDEGPSTPLLHELVKIARAMWTNEDPLLDKHFIHSGFLETKDFCLALNKRFQTHY